MRNWGRHGGGQRVGLRWLGCGLAARPEHRQGLENAGAARHCDGKVPAGCGFASRWWSTAAASAPAAVCR